MRNTEEARPAKKAKTCLSQLKPPPSDHETASSITSIPVFAVEGLTPKRLWQDHVSQRKPALIQGHLQQKEWKASRTWTNEYLVTMAVSQTAEMH